MAIKWFNIRTGLTTVTEQEPQTAALLASSDHSPNITQGQDFGWRLAPEVVVEMKKIKQHMPTLQQIATRFNKMLEDISESDILTYISNRTALEEAPVAEVDQYADDYDLQVKAAEKAANDKGFGDTPETVPSTTTTTTKSLDQLRAELAEREAAESSTTTQTTTKSSTTTTTTQAE